MNSVLSRIRVVSFIVLIISIIFCCGYAYADESIAQAFVLTEENEIKGVSKYIDYIKKSDSEHVTDAVLDVFDVSDNGDMIVGFTDGGMNAYNQLGEFIFGLEIDNSKAKYYFQFYGDNLLVSSMRSRNIYEITRDGEVCKVWNKVKVDKEAESRLLRYLDKPSRIINGYTYERSAYPSQFVKISPNGERQVIYKAAHIYPIGGVLYFVFFMLIGLHVFWSLGRGHFYRINYSEKKEKERQEQLAAKRQMRKLAEEYRLFEQQHKIDEEDEMKFEGEADKIVEALSNTADNQNDGVD